jgi:hypothetical protein
MDTLRWASAIGAARRKALGTATIDFAVTRRLANTRVPFDRQTLK